MGALEEAIAISREYALTRYVASVAVPSASADLSSLHSKQFGKPLAAFQLVQKKLADASMEASRARRIATAPSESSLISFLL